MQKTTNIIFDFDGVLIDSFEFHRKKIEAFAKIELSINDYKNLHDWNFFQHNFGELKNINWL